MLHLGQLFSVPDVVWKRLADHMGRAEPHAMLCSINDVFFFPRKRARMFTAGIPRIDQRFIIKDLRHMTAWRKSFLHCSAQQVLIQFRLHRRIRLQPQKSVFFRISDDVLRICLRTNNDIRVVRNRRILAVCDRTAGINVRTSSRSG